MSHQPARQARTDDQYDWLRDGSVPQSREDRVAEALALIALIFSLSIGLVIAMLPVSAQAIASGEVAPMRVPSASEGLPARPGPASAAQVRGGELE